MRNQVIFYSFMLALFSLNAYAGDIHFWDVQRKGTNSFANVPTPERFQDAAKTGIVIMRIAPTKWLNGRPKSEMGDFLIGPKDQYSGIVDKDLKYLLKALDDANSAGLKVVLTMLSLPGSRWSQHNCKSGQCVQQFDLWQDFKYHKQTADFWRDLARALKDHPAIVGYNIINEPAPERGASTKLRDWYTMDYKQWYQQVKGTPADLNLFYKTVIQAIREVDKDTPIVLDSGFYANPYAFQILDPAFIGDSKVLYSIHTYEPARFAYDPARFARGSNQKRYNYPGDIPTGELNPQDDQDAEPPFAPVEHWDRKKFDSYFKVVTDWMAINQIPANRIYLAEFGGYRDEAKGLAEYFRDSIDFFNSKGWHWSFYAYREDDAYPHMDYELGTGKTPAAYWECSKNYSCEKAGVYKANPLWKVIEDGLKAN